MMRLIKGREMRILSATYSRWSTRDLDARDTCHRAHIEGTRSSPAWRRRDQSFVTARKKETARFVLLCPSTYLVSWKARDWNVREYGASWRVSPRLLPLLLSLHFAENIEGRQRRKESERTSDRERERENERSGRTSDEGVGGNESTVKPVKHAQ